MRWKWTFVREGEYFWESFCIYLKGIFMRVKFISIVWKVIMIFSVMVVIL